MRWRLTQNDVLNRVNVEDPRAVCAEVRRIFEQRYPGAPFALLERVFDDIARLFSGKMPGYAACDTLYHDLRHTLDMTLAIARLVDGHDRSHAPPEQLGPRRALLGVIAALFHDSGYLHGTSENVANGAVLTPVHVSRSAAFVSRYLGQIGLGEDAAVAAAIVHFTGYEIAPDKIHLASPFDRKLGYMLGSADLLGQMSDRLYLEKCRDFLYQEFVLAGIARKKLEDGSEQVVYASPGDLLAKTPSFHDHVAMKRLNGCFDGVHRYAAAHFDGDNRYLAEIARNMGYLKDALAADDLGLLRRESVSLSQGCDPCAGDGEQPEAGLLRKTG